jgi:hypothetical protein
MSKKKNSSPARRPPASSGGDYASWLMLVPKDKRKEVADFVSQAQIDTYDDLVGFSSKIMAALVEGRITPVIAQELRAWHELNFTILATKNSVEGSPQDAYTDIVTALVQVKRETKQLRGDYFTAEEIEQSEPVVLEAKNG